MLIAISAPADNERGPVHAEQVLTALHEANVARLPVVLSFSRHDKTVGLYCRYPTELRSVVESQLAAAYPNGTLIRLPDEVLDPPPEYRVWSAELRLTPDLFPIRRYPQFEDRLGAQAADPLTAILAALAPSNSAGFRLQIEISVRPAGRRRCRAARRHLAYLAFPFFRAHPQCSALYASAAMSRHLPLRLLAGIAGRFVVRDAASTAAELSGTASRTHDRENDIHAAADKLGRHLFEARLRLLVFTPPGSDSQAKARIREMASAFGQFTVPRLATFRLSRIRGQGRLLPLRRGRGFLLSAEELATLWHPATAAVRAPKMETVQSRELEPPPVLPTREREPELAVLGRTRFRSRRETFGIRPADRLRHVAVLGKTGMGKSTLLHRLIASDIQCGRGVALIDPHGDLAEAVLCSVPRHRTNDVVLFDAGDREYPLAFNPLSCRVPEQRPLVASGVVSAFKKLYGDSWGPRLEHILRNAVLALVETPGTSLVSLMQLLSDGGYRRRITERLADPVVRSFWSREFAAWKPAYQTEAVAPIQNKVGQFLSSPVLRGILGQCRSSLDLRRVMDEGRVLVVNLSKGRVGEDASTLLGSLLVTGLQIAAMGRADVPEADRRSFHLYVDEFQNFATESFATILSEARKYRLTLTLANQYLAQMDERTADALFGNVGSLLVFQVGARDAEILAEQLGGDAAAQDLMALPRFTAYARLLIDGMPSRPFSMETLPPPAFGQDAKRSEIIRRTSRHRYARPARRVETEIREVFAA